MKKDLIIGGASNYTWDQLKYWVNSIKMSGFKGDIVIVGTNLKKATIDKLREEEVTLSLYGRVNADGDIVSPSNNAPHVERFFYIWNYLNSLDAELYENVITTDTRDVVFQDNPSDWLEEYMIGPLLVASSEGIRYCNEPWGNKNLLDAFGPFFHNLIKDEMIYNVGTLAGEIQSIKGLLAFIFQLSINRPIPIVDQAVYNYILHQAPFSYDTFFTNNEDAWAIQLGTTIGAVKSGKGEIGIMFKQDPSKYEAIYEDNQPVIEDGVVKTPDGKRYCIVHQYDRVDDLREQIERIYG